MIQYFAGIGARETPEEVLDKMTIASKFLIDNGLVLRSGGAKGADTAFYKGYLGSKSKTKKAEIYLPFKSFNHYDVDNITFFGPPTKEARLFTKNYHPAWDNVSCMGRDFMSRNAYRVLGQDLQTPSAFVLCYTKNGKYVGGTSQAMRIADDYKIPIINFGNQTDDQISETLFNILESISNVE